ncbi:hypothetical protein COO60DRAFT_1553392 [Scenedesmus sp. NREL 46B-D3]|nr:hypothetical protein COO60DRAFT_1553392 [Scenedesmus sp. NREL 46B-D3]
MTRLNSQWLLVLRCTAHTCEAKCVLVTAVQDSMVAVQAVQQCRSSNLQSLVCVIVLRSLNNIVMLRCDVLCWFYGLTVQIAGIQQGADWLGFSPF